MMIGYQLHDVPSDDLIIQLKRLVGSSNELTAQLLAHLAEVDARGLYRSCACATLYAYCVYELRLSEDEAQRRCRAARVARQFPLLFDMLADGSIHLTGILLLAPHLTQENHDELLARARYRTKREIEKLVADVAPCADVPSLIQPLGRAPEAPGRPPSTWAALVRGWAGPVRQLVPGDGPAQAPMGELARQVAHGDSDEAPSSHDSRPASEETAAARGTISSPVPGGSQACGTAPEREAVGPCVSDGGSPSPARETIDHPSAPDGSQPRGVQRYKVQFTADQGYVELVERARDLLQHEVFDRDLARVHQLAMEALLEKLSKRKYAGRGSELRGSELRGSELRGDELRGKELRGKEQRGDEVAPRLTPASATRAAQPAIAGAPLARVDTVTPGAGGRVEQGRHIPANVKRAVWERDGARCTFTDGRGQRCRETTLLEFHHREAYAKGGPTSLENLTLHCRSHNLLAAEAEFGRAFVDNERGAAEDTTRWASPIQWATRDGMGAPDGMGASDGDGGV